MKLRRIQKNFLTLVFVTILGIASCGLSSQLTQAQTTTNEVVVPVSETATASATISASPAVASPAANVQEVIQKKVDQDITETGGKQEDDLKAFLEARPPEPLSWNNFLEQAIRAAVKRGTPANVIVLVVLFPLVASLIAASRHIIGLRGFGIYIPAVLSVALVSIGLFTGLLIFLAIITVALLSKRLLNNLILSYLPRTALLLWMISLAILVIILITSFIDVSTVAIINIFPILILVLLSENFLDAQSSTKPSDALILVAETIILAFIAGFILRWEYLRQLALVEPELLIILTASLDLLVGKFTGLRLTEWLRFRPIIEEE